jgi:hypothetical protein
MNPESAPRASHQPLLVLSPTDEAILRMLATAHYATAFDLAAWVASPGSLTSVRSRASFLAGGADHVPRQVLYRFPFPSSSGNPERIFTLGALGRAVVGELGSFRPSKQRVLSHAFLKHALLLTRVVSLAHAFVKRSPAVRLRQCRLSYEWPRAHPKLAPIPDAWLLFDAGGRNVAIWLECDNSSEFQVKWKNFLRRRLIYIRSGDYAKAFGVPGVILAYVVTGPTAAAAHTRRQTLLGWGREVLAELKLETWAEIFRFTSLCLDERIRDQGGKTRRVYDRGLFEKPVWHRADVPDHPVPLLPA